MADPDVAKGWRRRCKRDEAKSGERLPSQLPHRFVRSLLAYGILVFLLTAFFIHTRQLPYDYLAWATLLGVLFGVAIAGFDRLASWLRTFLALRCSRAICGFLLFFAYVLGYLVLFSLIVTYPVGILIERGSGSAATAMAYGLFTINIILVFAILGWLDWERFVASRRDRFPWHRRPAAPESEGAKTLDK